MRAVWKFPVELANHQLVSMPEGAQILTAQMQQETLCIWAIVETTAPRESRHIAIHGTGHPMLDGVRYSHIGTYQLNSGMLVFHVFELHS